MNLDCLLQVAVGNPVVTLADIGRIDDLAGVGEQVVVCYDVSRQAALPWQEGEPEPFGPATNVTSQAEESNV